jgi:hypothetical protein
VQFSSLPRDHASAALLRYFVSQFAAEPPVPDRSGALPGAIQLPNANVLVIVKTQGFLPTGAELRRLSVDYARDVLLIHPGPSVVIPVLADTVFSRPAGPLLLTDLTACRLSNELLWLVPRDSSVRVSIGKEGMRLVPRQAWWSAVDLKRGHAVAHAEMASTFRAQLDC